MWFWARKSRRNIIIDEPRKPKSIASGSGPTSGPELPRTHRVTGSSGRFAVADLGPVLVFCFGIMSNFRAALRAAAFFVRGVTFFRNYASFWSFQKFHPEHF